MAEEMGLGYQQQLARSSTADTLSRLVCRLPQREEAIVHRLRVGLTLDTFLPFKNRGGATLFSLFRASDGGASATELQCLRH